jgi:hypothetical protein
MNKITGANWASEYAANPPRKVVSVIKAVWRHANLSIGNDCARKYQIADEVLVVNANLWFQTKG